MKNVLSVEGLVKPAVCITNALEGATLNKHQRELLGVALSVAGTCLWRHLAEKAINLVSDWIKGGNSVWC